MAGSALLTGAVLFLPACSSSSPSSPSSSPSSSQGGEWSCQIPAGAATPDYLDKTGCESDFQALASLPLDASLPGARSGKVVLDLWNDNQLYFQNSTKYPIHYKFAQAHLNGKDELAIGDLSSFNPQYTAPLEERRFLLGAVTYYEDPDVWALEIAPYDTSTAAMITQLYRAVADHAFYGPRLRFHPTSDDVEAHAKGLDASVPVVTTDQLYESIDYQPLNLGEAVGTLKILKSEDLENVYVSSRDIVVLDAVPNDIAPVGAIVTEMFQTPLSHINVLARNRHTPNMGLRNATKLDAFVSKAGKQVRLVVRASGYSLEVVSQADSDAWWTAHAPPKVSLPPLDLTVTDLLDIKQVTKHTDAAPYVSFDDIQRATSAFGAKAANYSVFSTDLDVPTKPAFAIPVFYYYQFMQQNGFFDRVKTLEADSTFTSDETVRDKKLSALRDDIRKGNVDAAFSALLKERLSAYFPGKAVRFRSSTNAEDLDGFPCAGCYDSHTGDPADAKGDQLAAALDAIRKTWGTVWSFRTYEERRLHGIEHTDVAMALLVHTNFPNEEANGVAVTNNVFDTSGNAPGFYVNVQDGGQYEVVHPPAGITSDTFLYLYSFPGQPITYYTHSNVLSGGKEHVLSNREIHSLGQALDAIHSRFRNAYQSDASAWYGMDCEFKFDDEDNPGSEPVLFIKQARPYPPPASGGE